MLVWAVFVLTAFGSAQPEPGFDPQDVVRQILAQQDMSPGKAPGPSRPGDSRVVPDRENHGLPSQPKTGGPDEPAVEDKLLPGTEFLLDTNNALVPAPGSQHNADIAFDGTNYLVVWEDQRGGGYPDICGARVTPAGVVLDPAGFTISQATYEQGHPAVAFDGTNYLVVWDDGRRGHVLDIFGARVTPGGTVLDPGGILIARSSNDRRNPDVGFDGTGFLVVWEDDRAGLDSTDIYGARVTTGGMVLDTAGIVISHAVRTQYTPAIAFDGTNFLVAWQDNRTSAEQADIYGARVTPAGTVLDPAGFNVSQAPDAQWSPDIAFDGTNFLVTWQDVRGSFPPVVSIYAGRVTPSGLALDPGGFDIAAGSGGTQPAVAFDGANFFVVWYEVHGLVPAYYSVWGRRVTPGGTVLDSAAIAVAPAELWSQQFPVTGFDGANFLVLWEDCRNKPNEPDIYGTRVTPAGTVLDTGGFVISLSARGQYAPALGFDGTNFLAVWEDDRAGYTDIYGARVTPDGTVLDPQGFAISQAANWQYYPVLVFDGTNYLVVWQDYRNDPSDPDIYGARVNHNGTVLDPGGIAISDAVGRQNYPALSFGGTDFLVVWQDGRSGSYDIYGTRVTTGGLVLNTDGIAISQSPGHQWKPAMDFDGTNYLIVWEDYRNSTSDIYGTRVTPQGTVLDPNGIAISQVDDGQYVPALGFDGSNFLVAWEDYRRSQYADIYGARVTPGGTVLDTAGLAICYVHNWQTNPALAFNDSNFLVLWEDDRRTPGTTDIYGTWGSPAGEVFGQGAIVWQPGSQTYPALARGTGSRLFLSYQGWAGTVGNKLYNSQRVWGKMDPTPGGIEETMNDERVTMNVGPTIVRGVLLLPSSLLTANSSLLSIDGRKVLDLRPGANDVRALAPGVYFVRAVSRKPSAVSYSKVVVTR
jgi:hypothetical protein